MALQRWLFLIILISYKVYCEPKLFTDWYDSGGIKLDIDEHGNYALHVGDSTWLRSSPAFVTAGRWTYDTIRYD